MTSWRFILIAATALLPVLHGCALTYSARSVVGHLNMVSASKPVDRVVKQPATSPALKKQLEQSREIREFATRELALPDNDSYRRYVDTGRDYASWAVFAAPEFSLAVRTWCFPVYGCVPYRGYFSKEEAEKFAATQREQGMDVHVSGVPAYSSLGWFDDPLLNTMVVRGDIYLAGVIFHELAHQEVYVKNDSGFNEAFAVTVEESGVEKWLKSRGETDRLRAYDLSLRINGDFQALIAETRRELHAIYTSDAGDDRKRAEKAEAIDRLRMRYRRLRDGKWNGFPGYDRWFEEPINNAKLAPIAVYGDQVDDFRRLLENCSGDYARFYRAVEAYAALDKDRRAEALREAKGCAGS